MNKPIATITPADRIGRWKKLWATPRLLDEDATDAAFEEFTDAFVPSHMHKLFLKTFGMPKAHFGNRFFKEPAQYQSWNTRLSALGAGEGAQVEVIVIYGSPDKLEAHALRGESRRTLRDIVIDEWFGACAIVRMPSQTLYVFIETKMTGCMVRSVPV